ncbi:MAG TPA: prolipoprotein diacylglyceryl transferase, partial [Chlamydiales bacterium]|nr:prolipoprotein diacylglyceryl transferase [Chlamydiales bacterium]
FTRLLFRFFSEKDPTSVRPLVRKVTDSLSLYLVIATIVGARLGHLLFYEPASLYLNDPLEIFRIRQGGLASHGAVIAILIALYFASKTIQKLERSLTLLRLLDLLAIVAPFAAFSIRIGNFFNQEILGTPTSCLLGITFGHPADGSAPIPCHPVQLYEAIAYLLLFFLMWRLQKEPRVFHPEGKLAGLLIALLFSIRFALETFKKEQSVFFSSTHVTMGQLLSLPLIALGIFLFFLPKKKVTSL